MVGAGACLGWLVLVFCERKTLLAGWFGLAETNKRTGWLNHTSQLCYLKHYFYNYRFTVLSLIKINNYEKEIITLLFEVLILSTLEVLGGVTVHMGPPTIGTFNASRRLPYWRLSTPSLIWAYQSLTQLTLPDVSLTIVKKFIYYILILFLWI